MASVPAARPFPVLSNPAHQGLTSIREVRVLVITSQLEFRRSLIQILETLSFDVVACLNLAQAEEVLAGRKFELIFCDERLTDGSYSDLIVTLRAERGVTPVIVTTRVGEWDLYMEALRKGAFDVIRYPCPGTDVELVILRALRERNLASSFQNMM